MYNWSSDLQGKSRAWCELKEQQEQHTAVSRKRNLDCELEESSGLYSEVSKKDRHESFAAKEATHKRELFAGVSEVKRQIEACRKKARRKEKSTEREDRQRMLDTKSEH